MSRGRSSVPDVVRGDLGSNWRGGAMSWRKRLPRKRKEKQRERAVREIAGRVWRYMFSQHRLTDETLRKLRRVESNCTVGGKRVTMIRIFDPAAAGEEGLDIEGFESLGRHMELILYAGYYRKVLGVATDIHVQRR
jgi:hypothetical protein